MNEHYVKYKDKIKATAKQWLADNQEVRLYHCAKQRAKRVGLVFDITIEDIVIPDVCPLLGVPITNTIGEGRIITNASIDRINSNEGYVKGNIQIISDLANRMKQNATETQLIAFAKGILNTYT